jgi:hypothetical protein
VSAAIQFEPETYYELRSNELFFTGKDVENSDEIKLVREEIVLCTEIISRRAGHNGRGKYARLVLRRGADEVVLFHRLSRFDRGSGQWREVNPMIVLALADQLPTL